MTRAIIAIFIISLSAMHAEATQTYCAVVSPQKDGFLALREGPGTTFAVLARLRPSKLLLVDTGTCRDHLCDESGKWVFVEADHGLEGWVKAALVNGGDKLCQIAAQK
jgi:hypothetical protein